VRNGQQSWSEQTGKQFLPSTDSKAESQMPWKPFLTPLPTLPFPPDFIEIGYKKAYSDTFDVQ
jgi:hypothetical protein